jgi:glycine oxidase
VVVIGGGIIGLSCAWQLLRLGKSVVVLDPSPASGASFVAGGMLGATAETTFSEVGSVDRHLSARAEWDPFLRDLSEDFGRSLPYASTSTVVVGVNRSDLAEIDHLVTFQRSLNLQVVTLGREALDQIVPGLGRSLRQGFHLVDDAAVDNRLILQALLDVIAQLKGHLVHERAEHLDRSDDGFIVTTPSGALAVSHIVVATGAAPALLGALPLPRVHPVSGVILRLKPRASTLQVKTTIRAIVNGRPCYFVPRSHGELVLGATSLERGYDLSVTAGELHQLLDDARIVFPSIDDYSVQDVEVGLRPTTLDHNPIVATIERGLTVALGHYRNGFLLAPATAKRVAGLVSGSIS